MPDPRIRRSRSPGGRHGRSPRTDLPGDVTPPPDGDAAPATANGDAGPDVTQHLEADAAASAEAQAAVQAAEDVAGEEVALTADEAATEPAVPAADATEPVGWFRDAPMDEDVDGALAERTDAPAGGLGDQLADEPVGAPDAVVRERDRPVLVPVEAVPQARRGNRLRGVLIGFVTIATVAAVGFVAGLMLPTILPGPGIGATPPPSSAPSESASPTVAPTPTPTPTAAPTPTPTPTAAPTAAPTQVVYVVKAGDQLARIAARYGVTVAAIQKANNIADPNLIKVGQKLIIPLPEATPAP